MMSLFIAFVLGSVLIGAGAMLAPAWSGDDNYTGLSTGAILAIVVVGAMAQTRLLGWDTLVIDYLIFGVVSAVILSGTLAGNAQVNEDEANTDDDTNIFALTITYERIFFVFILLGYTGLLVFGGERIPVAMSISIDQLSHSDTAIVDLISVYLSTQMRQDVAIVQPAVVMTLAFVTVMVAHDVGRVWGGVLVGRVLSLIGVLVAGYLLFMSNIFLLINLLFGLASVGWLRSAWERVSWQVVILCGVVLGACVYASEFLFWSALAIFALWMSGYAIRYRGLSRKQIVSGISVVSIAIVCAAPVVFLA